MDETDENMSADDVSLVDSPLSIKVKPKKRSLVERELETNLTARVTSPVINGDTCSTSRYGRARRIKTEPELSDSEKILKEMKSPTSDRTPIKVQSPVYKMHASNSPIKSEPKETPKKVIATDSSLENQIENIYHENISLSRFGSDEKKNKSPGSKFPKVYVRKDLIQKREKDETIVLIKNMFSPVKSPYRSANSHLNNVLERSSEKYLNTASKPSNGYLNTSSVVKTLDFDSNKKKKKENRDGKGVLSKSDLFDMEAKCEYQVGDLAWARMGTYPFWPCIVTREPSSGMFVKKKLFGRIERDVVHVTFFGDNGRRSWIVDTMLRKFLGQLEFEAVRERFSPSAKKRDPKLYTAYFISEKKMPQWTVSVEEAETLLREPKRLRIDILNEMLSKCRLTKSASKTQRSSKITRTSSDVSLSESLYDTLFSEDDGKTEDPERSRSKVGKSLDVSEVVTACLDNMAAKTGITKIQRQSHMDRWLQKAKSKTPEKLANKPTPQKKGKEVKVISSKKKKISPTVPKQKPYSFRKSVYESRNLKSHHNEHDYSTKIDTSQNDSEVLESSRTDAAATVELSENQSTEEDKVFQLSNENMDTTNETLNSTVDSDTKTQENAYLAPILSADDTLNEIQENICSIEENAELYSCLHPEQTTDSNVVKKPNDETQKDKVEKHIEAIEVDMDGRDCLDESSQTILDPEKLGDDGNIVSKEKDKQIDSKAESMEVDSRNVSQEIQTNTLLESEISDVKPIHTRLRKTRKSDKEQKKSIEDLQQDLDKSNSSQTNLLEDHDNKSESKKQVLRRTTRHAECKTSDVISQDQNTLNTLDTPILSSKRSIKRQSDKNDEIKVLESHKKPPVKKDNKKGKKSFDSAQQIEQSLLQDQLESVLNAFKDDSIGSNELEQSSVVFQTQPECVQDAVKDDTINVIKSDTILENHIQKELDKPKLTRKRSSKRPSAKKCDEKKISEGNSKKQNTSVEVNCNKESVDSENTVEETQIVLGPESSQNIINDGAVDGTESDVRLDNQKKESDLSKPILTKIRSSKRQYEKRNKNKEHQNHSKSQEMPVIETVANVDSGNKLEGSSSASEKQAENIQNEIKDVSIDSIKPCVFSGNIENGKDKPILTKRRSLNRLSLKKTNEVNESEISSKKRETRVVKKTQNVPKDSEEPAFVDNQDLEQKLEGPASVKNPDLEQKLEEPVSIEYQDFEENLKETVSVENQDLKEKLEKPASVTNLDLEEKLEKPAAVENQTENVLSFERDNPIENMIIDADKIVEYANTTSKEYMASEQVKPKNDDESMMTNTQVNAETCLEEDKTKLHKEQMESPIKDHDYIVDGQTLTNSVTPQLNLEKSLSENEEDLEYGHLEFTEKAIAQKCNEKHSTVDNKLLLPLMNTQTNIMEAESDENEYDHLDFIFSSIGDTHKQNTDGIKDSNVSTTYGNGSDALKVIGNADINKIGTTINSLPNTQDEVIKINTFSNQRELRVSVEKMALSGLPASAFLYSPIEKVEKNNIINGEISIHNVDNRKELINYINTTELIEEIPSNSDLVFNDKVSISTSNDVQNDTRKVEEIKINGEYMSDDALDEELLLQDDSFEDIPSAEINRNGTNCENKGAHIGNSPEGTTNENVSLKTITKEDNKSVNTAECIDDEDVVANCTNILIGLEVGAQNQASDSDKINETSEINTDVNILATSENLPELSSSSKSLKENGIIDTTEVKKMYTVSQDSVINDASTDNFDKSTANNSAMVVNATVASSNPTLETINVTEIPSKNDTNAVNELDTALPEAATNKEVSDSTKKNKEIKTGIDVDQFVTSVNRLPEPVKLNGFHVEELDFSDGEFNAETSSINSEDSEPLSITKSKLLLKNRSKAKKALEDPEFVKYLELRQDEIMDQHPELSQEEIIEYLFKTWEYEENAKHDIVKSDDIEQSGLVKGLNQHLKPKRSKNTRDKKKVKKRDEDSWSLNSDVSDTSVKRRLRTRVAKSPAYIEDNDSVNTEVSLEIKTELLDTISINSDVSYTSTKHTPAAVDGDLAETHTPETKDKLSPAPDKIDKAEDSKQTKTKEKTKSPKNRENSIKSYFKTTDSVSETKSNDDEPIAIDISKKIKEEYDPDTVSLNSEDSEVSQSKKRRKYADKTSKSMTDPEFLKYVELRQDALIDENPQLSQDEIVSYLYKTWLYEESVKPDLKKNDDLEQASLVKGLNQAPSTPQHKRVRKKVKVEKDYLEDDVQPKDKPKRKISQPYYNENLSDVEDEIELFEIFKPKKKLNMLTSADGQQIKTENQIIDEEVIEIDEVDEVEVYFTKLTEPKPNVFKGFVREKVCEICERTGNLIKCKGCNCMFHAECVKKEKEIVEVVPEAPTRGRKKKKKNVGRKPKNLEDSGSHSDEKSQDVSEEFNASMEEEFESRTVNADDFEAILAAKMQEMLPTEILNYDSYSSDDGLDWNSAPPGKCEIVDVKLKRKTVTDYSNFKCNKCEKYSLPVCFVCKEAVSKTGVETRQRCQTAHCHKYYHLECLDHWPQTQFQSGEPSKSNKKISEHFEALMCPRHVCHTCVSDDPRGCKTRFSGDKLARCVRCPATYHSFTKCLPAGSQILTASLIVCPRHYEHRPGKVPCHVNTGWCFICALGGSLICCEYCPTSFHAECLNIKPPEGGYMCEDCETGRLPLYGEMVWVKLGHYRWWPGIILHPTEIPENIMAVKHSPGEFVVRFFGQYDHYWVNRGRVFPFQEGDSGKISSQKSKIDAAFTTAMEHAQRACEILKSAAPNEEESLDIASSLLPPHYVKLKVNKPCGSLCGRRVDAEESSLTQCECDPTVDDPCGPYSHCLNRMLLTECGPACRAGERCSNRAFERRRYPRLAPRRAPQRGWGLRTLDDIKAGQFVIEYVGELIDEEEFRRRMNRKHEIRDENFYFLTLDKERMIDAGPKGNLARFMNHCCEPNCETQKWTVLGDVRVGLFALYDIPANSELTFNYNLECAGIEKKRCMCGAKRCSGYIGAKPKQEETQPKKGKDQKPAKRTYKKRKNVEESPSTSKTKPKRPVGRPAKPRELTEIEKDLLIIKNATNGLSSDSEGSGRLSSVDGERYPKALKRKRVSFSTEECSKKAKVEESRDVGD